MAHLALTLTTSLDETDIDEIAEDLAVRMYWGDEGGVAVVDILADDIAEMITVIETINGYEGNDQVASDVLEVLRSVEMRED